MNWIAVAENTGNWRDLVNAVKNLRVPQDDVNFLTG